MFVRASGLAAAGLALALAALPIPRAAAQPQPATPNRAFNNLCMMIGDHMRSIKHPSLYLYEERILTAAGALDDKDPEVIRRKVQRVWDWSHPHLYCTNTQFDVPRGNILKYAVSSYFDDFIDDVIRWGIDLNRYDHEDDGNGGTVLDYVRFHMIKSAGGALERKLAGYYRKLREAGALHRRELPGTPAHARLSAARDFLVEATAGRTIRTAAGQSILSELRATADRRLDLAGAALEGDARVASLTGLPCYARLEIDDSAITLVAGGRRHALADSPPFRAHALEFSPGWDLGSATSAGNAVRLTADHWDGPVVIAVADAETAKRAAAEAEYLKKTCRPF